MSRLIAIAGIVFLSLAAHANDAESILMKARELQLERWDGVQNYTVEQTTVGMKIVVHYERVSETSFRVVPQGGLQPGAGAADGGQVFMDFDDIQEIAGSAKLLGTETISGRKGYRLKSENVEHVQTVDDESVEFDTFEIWIDTEHYVPLKMKVHGTATGPEGSRPIMIEKVDTDYRQVPGSKLYEAYKQTMTMSGVMDEAQQKEMQEAQKQMAEMEKQLASMPAAQRQMMEQMMGPQLEIMKNMAADGGVTIETTIDEIRVNSDM